ncbi:hypothetical protein H6792_00660 [Candidatus Nomurabacteria bacterium]|nr:hypothetical protein [Candidatus Nomurabacteria bacterium]
MKKPTTDVRPKVKKSESKQTAKVASKQPDNKPIKQKQSFDWSRITKAIGLIILILAITLFAHKILDKGNPIHDLEATTYLSKSSRDKARQAQTDFNYADPIQLGLDFELDDLDDDQVINLDIKVFEVSSQPNAQDLADTAKTEPLKTITIGQIKSGENLFVTIPNPGKKGTYRIEVYLDQEHPAKLTELDFSIISDNSEAEAENQELEQEFNSALEQQQRADDPASAESDPTDEQTNQTAQ